MAVFTTAARTWAVGETVTAANLNAQLRDFNNGFGAFTAYTPAVTGWTLGNGTIVGTYLQVGKLVVWRARLTLGTTTTIAGTLAISYPVAALTSGASHSHWVQLYGASNWVGHATRASSTTCTVWSLGTNGVMANMTSTVPFTWASGNLIDVGGTFEAA